MRNAYAAEQVVLEVELDVGLLCLDDLEDLAELAGVAQAVRTQNIP